MAGITDKQLLHLQNIQDTKSNCFRFNRVSDDLQGVTERFSQEDETNEEPEADAEEETANNLSDGLHLQAVLDFLNGEVANEERRNDDANGALQDNALFNFDSL